MKSLARSAKAMAQRAAAKIGQRIERRIRSAVGQRAEDFIDGQDQAS